MDTHFRARRGALTATLLFLTAFAAAPVAHSAPADAELQKKVRAATFEVVLRKPEKDLLTYEKPLPLELLPYTERTDKYYSIGTAFTVAPGVFISAGHVMLSGIGSQFGPPSLRDSAGTVYPIDRVTKFSLHEDFMVFTVSPTPSSTPLQTSATPAIDTTVYAVGNALGEGVVIRDGLLTSMTPEDQDGRWKWLRFSAAASPGNSGGPLLDAQGHVVGLVTMRSASENLNYALPIERVANARENLAAFDVRSSFALPILQDSQVSLIKTTFNLPQPFAEFTRRYREVGLRHFRAERDKLLADKADQLFPKGASSKLLAASRGPTRPVLILQDDDRTWSADDGSVSEKVDLPDDGWVELRLVNGVLLFTLSRGHAVRDEAFYSDSRAFMDLLLKGMKLPRIVGPQAIRITSAGPAATDKAFVDTSGRRWQFRSWQLGYADTTFVVAALPTPDGYVGMVRFSQAAEVETVEETLQLLTGYFQTPFKGTLAQWEGYLAHKSLRASAFDSVKVSRKEATGLAFESPRLRVSVPPDLIKLTDASTVRLDMVHLLDGSKLAWGVSAISVSKDGDGETYVSAYRQAKPAQDAGRDLLKRWDQMLKREGSFSGAAVPEQNYRFFSTTTSVAAKMATDDRPDPSSSVLYELVYRTGDRLLPRDMETRQRTLTQSLVILEK